MQHDFQNKTVLITGGSRGQGAAEARLFAQHRARVVIGDVVADEGEALAKAIRAAGGVCEFRKLDVADEKDWHSAVTFAKDRFGGLDVLVNNAGISLRGVDIEHTTREQWDRVLGVNLTGCFLGIRTVAPLMKAARAGAIVNIGSTAGINGHFAAAYSAAKWGLRGLTKAAAMEYAEFNIRVNAVHPSILETHMTAGSQNFVDAMVSATPLGRAASVEDIAYAVMFLASDEAAFLTGIDLPVDGGFTELGVYRAAWWRATGRQA
ncbi:MAG TPA: SDR family NAD(P)-dependent oxidoreductase [Pseudolabrys sp.]|nr:SDR family NAD(P)-dependent oxidoreductase [Pseudolabrys sp.]